LFFNRQRGLLSVIPSGVAGISNYFRIMAFAYVLALKYLEMSRRCIDMTGLHGVFFVVGPTAVANRRSRLMLPRISRQKSSARMLPNLSWTRFADGKTRPDAGKSAGIISLDGFDL